MIPINITGNALLQINSWLKSYGFRLLNIRTPVNGVAGPCFTGKVNFLFTGIVLLKYIGNFSYRALYTRCSIVHVALKCRILYNTIYETNQVFHMNKIS